MRSYSEKDYLNSISSFGKVYTRYPSYFQNPIGLYYIARSFYNLDSRELAMQNAFKCLLEFPASKAVPYAYLLLLEISIADRSIDMADEYYLQLLSTTVDDSMLIAANYHMGVAYLQKGEFEIAKQYLKTVPSTFHEYENAQKELLILNYLQSNNLEYPKLETFCNIDNYYKDRGIYAELSMFYNELVLTEETKYANEQIAVYKEKIKNQYSIMMQYRQLIEDEKNRILKLAEESQ